MVESKTKIVTVPGNISGLLRPNAPLRLITAYENTAAVVLSMGEGDVCCTLAVQGKHNWNVGECYVSDGQAGKWRLEFILSEPAGRDIAARWMAETLGLEVGLTAPDFYYDEASHSWVLGVGTQTHDFTSVSDGVTKPYTIIPNLPMDPGQGIEAMRLIILRLAGRPA